MKTVPPGFDQSFVYGPIRSFDTNPFKALESVNHLIQVRDPRDILVSEYYSLGWIHSDKGWTEKDKQLRSAIQKVSIDEFVVNEAKFSKYSLLDRYSPILDLIGQKNVTIVRYEDMVLDFGTWLGSVLEVAKVQPRLIWHNRLQRLYRDEFLAGGKANPHKRNVLPGDHRRKLTGESIAELNRQFESVLDRLGYVWTSNGSVGDLRKVSSAA